MKFLIGFENLLREPLTILSIKMCHIHTYRKYCGYLDHT
jgi:hypothetical protein